MHPYKILFSVLLATTLSATGCGPGAERPIRILTAGIMHETNTFNPLPTGENDFRMLRGEEVTKDAEWARMLQEAGVEIIATTHADAQSRSLVTSAAYERIKTEILDGAQRAGPVDGVYLELHGALHVEGYEDAQVDLIRSLRKIVGEETIISASFDLHGNISRDLADGINILTRYRTAPHLDGVETRVRAVRLLLDAIRRHRIPRTVLVKVPIIIPGERGITSVEPLRSIYAQIPSIAEKHGLLDGSLFVGMPWTDVPRASMSVLVVAESQDQIAAAEQEARRLATLLWEKRDRLVFDVPTDTIEGALATALKAPEKTVFITDSGDNVTAGAPGDTTIVLKHLLARHVKDAVVAGITDPAAVEACEKAGVGNQVRLSIGGKLDTAHGKPLEIAGTVRFVSPTADATYEIIRGLVRPAGKTAVVEVDGIHVALVSLSRAFTAPEHFEDIGIDPLGHKIVVVKLGYLFEALREIAPRTIMALTPGSAYQLIEDLPYKKVRRPIYPLDPDMRWTP